MDNSIKIERSCSCGQRNHAQCGKHYVIHHADCGIYCGACNGRWWCHASPCNLLGKGTCYNLNFDKYFQGWLSIVYLVDKPISLSLCSQVGNVVILVNICLQKCMNDLNCLYWNWFCHSNWWLFFWTFQIQPILKKYDILLVADEVPYLVLISVLFCSFEPQYW